MNTQLCQICDSAYIETTQQNVEYVCTMCRENNPDREMPDEYAIDWELVNDCGNY